MQRAKIELPEINKAKLTNVIKRAQNQYQGSDGDIKIFLKGLFTLTYSNLYRAYKINKRLPAINTITDENAKTLLITISNTIFDYFNFYYI